MNEQEKALQGMVEFCKWLIPNAKQLGLESSKSIAMISNAKTSDELVQGINGLYQELGEEQFTALTKEFQKSKQQNIKMAKQGSKIDYLVKKFDTGGENEKLEVPVHEKWNRTPWGLSFMAAYLSGKKVELPMRKGTTVRRTMVRVKNPTTGTIMDRIHREDGNGNTYRIITPDRDTVYEYNGMQYFPGDEMYDRYENAWEAYGIYKTGGKIDFSRYKIKK